MVVSPCRHLRFLGGCKLDPILGCLHFFREKKTPASPTRLRTQCPDESTNQGPNSGGSVGRMADGWVFSVVPKVPGLIESGIYGNLKRSFL